MSSRSVAAIKEAISALPEDEKVSLAAWLSLQTMDAWDEEMRRDFSPGGKGTDFLTQVKREIAEGKARPIKEGFSERRRRRS